MKFILAVLFGTFLLFSCKNQTLTPKVVVTKTETSYCELIGQPIPDSDEEFTIYLRYGGEVYEGLSHAGITSDLPRKYGRDTLYYVSEDRMVSALNLMSKKGWEFVQAYSFPVSSDYGHEPIYFLHYILKRTTKSQ